jgi:hypothetical protein
MRTGGRPPRSPPGESHNSEPRHQLLSARGFFFLRCQIAHGWRSALLDDSIGLTAWFGLTVPAVDFLG